MIKSIEKRFKVKSGDNLPYRGFSRKCNRNELMKLFNEFGFKKGVEVGTQIGRFAEIICQSIEGVELSCVDPWIAYGKVFNKQERHDNHYEEAKERLEPYNVNLMKMTSMEAVEHFEDESLDFVYIDGDHEFDAVMMDVIKWSKKVKKGGVIAGHDYYFFYRSGVVEAVNAYTHCHGIKPWYITREVEPSFFWIK